MTMTISKYELGLTAFAEAFRTLLCMSYRPTGSVSVHNNVRQPAIGPDAHAIHRYTRLRLGMTWAACASETQCKPNVMNAVQLMTWPACASESPKKSPQTAQKVVIVKGHSDKSQKTKRQVRNNKQT